MRKAVKNGILLSVLFFMIGTFFCYSAHAFEFPDLWYKRKLERVQALFEDERYDEIYHLYLSAIPSFNPHFKNCEMLFYYYVRTCIITGRFDEAEGYLYRIRTKKRVLSYPGEYDFLWALLFDKQGKTALAYEKYLFFTRLHPTDHHVPYAYKRLGTLAQQLGDFKRAQDHFDTLLREYASSMEAQVIQTSDDRKLAGYLLVFDMFALADDAEARMHELSQAGFPVRLFITKLVPEAPSYLVAYDAMLPRDEAEKLKNALHEKGYDVTVYPEKESKQLDVAPAPRAG